jgi:hypothetical protein
MGATDVKEACEMLQLSIDTGKEDLEEDYLRLLQRMSEFLNHLNEFAKNISKKNDLIRHCLEPRCYFNFPKRERKV